MKNSIFFKMLLWLCLSVLGAFLIQACSFQSESDRLHALIDETDQYQEERNPFRGDEERDLRQDDRLWAESLGDLEEEYRFWLDIYERLQDQVNRENLVLNDQITYDSFLRSVTNRVKEYEYQTHLIPINHEGGFYNRLLGLEDQVPLEDVEDYENYLARLKAIPQFFDEHIERMRAGMEQGYTLPSAIFVDDYTYYIETHIKEDPAETAYYEPFQNVPDEISDDDRNRLEEQARSVISDDVMGAFRGFSKFLETEYIPAARESIATVDLPNGEAYYNYLVEYHTTLPLSAEEVHQTGLDEVDRIKGEMMDIIEEVEFTGSFEEFLEFLRTDPQFFVDEPVDLLKEAMWHSKRMDGKLPELFHIHNLPRRSYGVEPVPDHLAPRYTGGRYSLGGGTRAGHYWVNTYDLPSRTLYTLEALTYHEAVPGHHLQIGLHQEMEDLPRRVGGLTAYSEGWALYAERLGVDAGLYKDPYSNFGRLTYEMWRACRLVVDTGMHALEWTRDEAVDFMTQNTALSHHEIDTEINRYIAVPGQALAYKTGELKIMELREMAEEKLGNDFDIRDFHEAVLKNGPVSLPVLESQVTEYVESTLEKMTEE
ncbi:MAG: DUF885 domain-containing protein [Bacteroidota bacterium]